MLSSVIKCCPSLNVDVNVSKDVMKVLYLMLFKFQISSVIAGNALHRYCLPVSKLISYDQMLHWIGEGLKVWYFHIGKPPELVRYLIFQMQSQIPFACRRCLCSTKFRRRHDVMPYFKNHTVHRREWNSLLDPSRLIGLRSPMVSSWLRSNWGIFRSFLRFNKPFRGITIHLLNILFSLWHPNHLLIWGVATARDMCAWFEIQRDSGWLHSLGKTPWAWGSRYRILKPDVLLS